MSDAPSTPATAEPPREPAGMKIVGIGVIASCITLSALFGWGVYLQLTDPCECACPAATEAGE